MNQIKLSLRAADDSRTIKEEGGIPTFATVFSLHNSARRGREETIPITVKASHELALTLFRDLKKGTAFVVIDSQGQQDHRPTEIVGSHISGRRLTNLAGVDWSAESLHLGNRPLLVVLKPSS